jgi:hypothetical protein
MSIVVKTEDQAKQVQIADKPVQTQADSPSTIAAT